MIIRAREILFAARKDRSGTTAIEFALVAPIFFALLFATCDVGWLMIRTMLLDRALDKTVRLVRIGGSGAPTSASAFKAALCQETIVIQHCLNNLTVDMTVITSSSSFPADNLPCASSSATPPSPKYSSGARGDLVVVRACLAVAPLIDVTGELMSIPRGTDGVFQVRVTNSFVSEPGQ